MVGLAVALCYGKIFYYPDDDYSLIRGSKPGF